MRFASRAFCLTPPSDTMIIELKMPMMAITTKSSIRVKPLWRMSFIIPNKNPAQAGFLFGLLKYGLRTGRNSGDLSGCINQRDCDILGFAFAVDAPCIERVGFLYYSDKPRGRRRLTENRLSRNAVKRRCRGLRGRSLDRLYDSRVAPHAGCSACRAHRSGSGRSGYDIVDIAVVAGPDF